MIYNRLAVLLTKYRTVVGLEKQIGCHQTTPLMLQIFNVTANENASNKRNELESKSFLCDDFFIWKKNVMWGGKI